MATTKSTVVVRQLRRAALLADGAGLTDGQLLECFLSKHDEAAFEALVRRHGPMVMGVCKRVIGNEDDAQDAFQASFLVLARKAASVSPREAVGSWLCGARGQRNLRLNERSVIHVPGERGRVSAPSELRSCLASLVPKCTIKHSGVPVNSKPARLNSWCEVVG